MGWFLTILAPLLLHMAVMELTAAVFGGRLDAASCTTLASALVLPAAVWMYRGDCRADKENDTKAGLAGKSRCVDRENDTKASLAGKGRRTDAKSSAVFPDTGQKTAKTLLLWGVLCFLGGAALNLAWSGILNLLHIQEVFSNRTQEQLLAAQIAVQILGLGVLVPVTEELIFRALICRRMKQTLGFGAAVFFSALLFAVYHGNPIQMIYAFPMAVVLALIYERGKGLLFPVLFHMGANLLAVLVNCM